MIEPSAVGLPMMLFTVLGVCAVVPIVIYALARRRSEPLQKLGMAAALWGGVYIILLLLASLTSRDRTLPAGERLAFCGFYIDCHIGVRVDGVRSSQAVEGSAGTIVADQVFHIVNVSYDSDARRARLRLDPEPRVTAIGDAGRFASREDATAAVRKTLGLSDRPVGTLDPQGGRISTAYVFDAPASEKLRLLVTTGDAVDRIIELFLIGDDGSMLHGKTYLATE